MPNEVFLRTRAGLSAMVSSRAADRILEGALKRGGHDPDEIDRLQMKGALLGPVLLELESVLPRIGLKRNLERLASLLPNDNDVVGGYGDARVSTGDSGDVLVAERPRALQTGTIPAGVVPVHELLTPVVSAASERPTLEATVLETAVLETAVLETVALNNPSPQASSPQTPSQQAPTLERARSDNELELQVTRFALIDHVRFVAAVRADGDVPISRGEGLDLASLARLSRLALSLLARGGTVRSLHLAHSQGQLFLFPFGHDLLVVFGAAELNLGAVTTAFTALALEEDL
ncbi:MAG: hypothetical protein WD273_07380 [Trueperaceae bacterium]